jgi:hypothetical protein
MVRFTHLYLFTLLGLSNASSIVEDAFVNFISDVEVITSTVRLLANITRSGELDIGSIARRGLEAHRDQEAQIALLVSFAGEASSDPFYTIDATNTVIENSYQSIIQTPNPMVARKEAQNIRPAMYLFPTSHM